MEIVIRINCHPNMSTTSNNENKATNYIDKICMVLPFWAVTLQFHLYLMLPKCNLYGPRSDCSFMVIWEQPAQVS